MHIVNHHKSKDSKVQGISQKCVFMGKGHVPPNLMLLPPIELPSNPGLLTVLFDPWILLIVDIRVVMSPPSQVQMIWDLVSHYPSIGPFHLPPPTSQVGSTGFHLWCTWAMSLRWNLRKIKGNALLEMLLSPKRKCIIRSVIPPPPLLFFWQPNLRGRGHMHSAYAVFKDPKDAQEAFDNIEGQEEKVYTF